MTVLRRIHTNNYTIIGNALLNDPNLKAEAVGVICYLIGKPHNWQLRPGELAQRFDCGADKIQRILKELIEAGYIRKVRSRDPKTQHWGAVEYIILDTKDEPLPENTDVAPTEGEEKPDMEKPQLAFPALLSKEDTKTERKKQRKPRVDAYTEEFEKEVWSPYPRKAGTSKANAFKRYSSLDDGQRELLRRAIPIYAGRMRGTEEKYIKHLESFINGRNFETIGQVASIQGPPCENAGAMDRQTWENLAKIYANNSRWNPEWGPEPGHPRCQMPADLQQRFVSSGLTH